MRSDILFEEKVHSKISGQTTRFMSNPGSNGSIIKSVHNIRWDRKMGSRNKNAPKVESLQRFGGQPRQFRA